MPTQTPTKNTTNTRLALGVAILFLAGGLALAALPAGQKKYPKSPSVQSVVVKKSTEDKKSANKEKASLSSSEVQKIVAKNNQLQQKAAALKRELPAEKTELITVLTEAERKLQEYNRKIAEAPASDKDRIVHLMGHERLSDTIATVEKIKNLPASLQEVYRLLDDYEKKIKEVEKAKLPFSLDSAKKVSKELRLGLKDIERKMQTGDTKGAVTSIASLHQQTLPALVLMRKDLRPAKANSQTLEELFSLHQRLTRAVTYQLPANYVQSGEQPRLAELSEEDIDITPQKVTKYGILYA